MAQPRPVLKRQNSKVRFSRGEMSPVGTMASDSTVHGVHGQHAPTNPLDHEYEQQIYDVNSYPFSEEIALSTSEAPSNIPQQPYYREIAPDEDIHPNDSQSQRHESNDGYTATPPRVGSRRWSTNQHRPVLDTLLSANGSELPRDVSPRGSTSVSPYDNPSRSPYHSSPRPAIRSSLVMPHPSGSPQRNHPLDERAEYNSSPYKGMPTRSSVPDLNTPSRRMLDQHQHRPSAPEYGSPIINSPQFGSPRGSQSPAIRRYPDYEAPVDRASPVPPYQSPRNSYARPPPRDWEEEKRTERQYGRLDSDATLQGDYRKGSLGEKGYGRPRSMSSDSGKSMVAERKPSRSSRHREDDEESYHVKGGVFSQLLRLTGRSSTLRRRVSSRGASTQGYGELPTMKTLGLTRAASGASTVFGAEELDPMDPRVTGQKKKKRRNSWTDLPFTRATSGDEGENPRQKRRASIQYHVAGE